jgi:hypothetical protein
MRAFLVATVAVLLVVSGCGKNKDQAAKEKGLTDRARDLAKDAGKSLEGAYKDAEKAIGDAATRAGEYARMKKEDFVAEMQKKAAEHEPTIETVKKKLGEASGDAKTELQKLNDKLVEHQKTFSAKLDAVKAATGDNWKEAIEGLTKAWDELSKAAGEAKAALEKK